METKTHVLFILDSSGSMAAIHKEAVNHFNEQIQQIKMSAGKQDVRVSLVTFNSPGSDKILYWLKPLAAIDELKYEEFKPAGTTALFDTIGKHVTQARNVLPPEEAGLVVIITDGEENSSTEFKGETVKKIMTDLEASPNWTVAYMGANQNMFDVAQHLGIKVQSTRSFDATGQGLNAAAGHTSSSYASYFNDREKGIQKKNFWDKES